ncbi:hypothetical protein QUB56_17790 [Microcoleus sp. AR_TQ3_B6]
MARMVGPPHHSKGRSQSSIGVAIPNRIDYRIPGTDRRNSVSCTDAPSDSDNNTALLVCPAIAIG